MHANETELAVDLVPYLVDSLPLYQEPTITVPHPIIVHRVLQKIVPVDVVGPGITATLLFGYRVGPNVTSLLRLSGSQPPQR